MELIVREAEERDINIILSFIHALSSHENSEEYVLTDVTSLRKDGFGPDKKFGALLAEKNGEAVGYLTYVWIYSTWASSHYMYMENLFVLEAYRRSGVGDALMSEAREVCKKNGRLHMKWEVQSDNERAIAFYKKQGATVSLRGIGSCKVK